MALTVSNYMIQPFFGEDDLPKSASTLLAAVFICGLTWLNCYSMKVTTRLQNVFMVTKVVALMLVILVGIYALSQGTYLAWGTSKGGHQKVDYSSKLLVINELIRGLKNRKNVSTSFMDAPYISSDNLI